VPLPRVRHDETSLPARSSEHQDDSHNDWTYITGSAQDRLTSRVQEYFAAEGINGGQFNHYAPAGALMRGALGKASLATSTLDRAEELMRRLNAFLPVV